MSDNASQQKQQTSTDDAARQDAERGAEQLKDAKRPVNKFVFIGVFVMLCAVGASIFGAFKFVEDERARALQEWQIRLGIVGDSRSAAINEWLEGNFKTMRELAENASLQLYMSEIASAKAPKAPSLDDHPFATSDGAAETTELRNILTARAGRTGF